MDERRVQRTTALTIDHLTARLAELERAFAALQRAYVELQAAAHERGQLPPAGAILPDGPDAPPVPRGRPDAGGHSYVA